MNTIGIRERVDIMCDNLEQLLILQAKSGNADALNTLLTKKAENIYAISYAILKNKEDAKDAMQQSLITVWHSISSLENTEAFDGWLYRIVYTRSLNILKEKKSHEIIMDDDISDIIQSQNLESDLLLPSEYAEQNDLRERLFKIIDSLSAVQRETIVLYYFNEKTVAEIAEIMSCTEGTVKSRLHLARCSIKNKIEEYENKNREKFFGVAIGVVPFGTFVVENTHQSMIAPDEFSNILTSAQKAAFISPPVTNGIYDINTAGLSPTTIAKSGFPLAAKIAIASVVAVAIVGAGIWTANVIPNPIQENNNNIGESDTSTQTTTQMPTSTPTQEDIQVLTDEPTQAITEPDYHEAYNAYKDVLIKDESAIREYTWQFKEDEPRPVVFADVMGDNTPEMIYVFADFNPKANSKSLKMRIMSYDGVSAVEAYTYDMSGYTENLGGGMFAFQINGEKNLYTYYRMNGMFNNELYSRFSETGEYSLVPEEIVYYQDDRGLGVEMDGRINGNTVSQSEAKAERDTLLNNAETLLLSSSDSSGNSYPRTLGIKAENKSMTYDEAIEFINKFNNGAEEIDYSVIKGNYTVRKNGMVSGTIKIDSVGTFVSEISGQSGGEYIKSVCRGRITNLVQENKYKYTFYLADIKLDNEPETTREEYINGHKVTVHYIDNDINTDTKFTLYLKGTIPSNMTAEDFENYKWWPIPDYEAATDHRLIFLPDGHIYDESGE